MNATIHNGRPSGEAAAHGGHPPPATARPVAPPVGGHLVSPRFVFTHHGIYVGHGEVVHYAGLSRGLCRGPVQRSPLMEFAAGHGFWVETAPCARYAGEPAARRALSRVGEDRYRITTNNCEHFCSWCLDGVGHSPQIERWMAWPGAMARALLATLPWALGIGSRPPDPFWG